jgi:hypothetical protein
LIGAFGSTVGRTVDQPQSARGSIRDIAIDHVDRSAAPFALFDRRHAPLVGATLVGHLLVRHAMQAPVQIHDLDRLGDARRIGDCGRIGLALRAVIISKRRRTHASISTIVRRCRQRRKISTVAAALKRVIVAVSCLDVIARHFAVSLIRKDSLAVTLQ